jgi:endonuclease YncB( thermonuclease family)
MLGAYPFAGNRYANNTIEQIDIYVKPGKPPKYPDAVKEPTRRTDKEQANLTQQSWFMMPTEIARKGHPAPFPERLPARLIKLFTFGAVATEGFAGEIVVDPFWGTGTTCVVAKRMGRRFIGIDIRERYGELGIDAPETDQVCLDEKAEPWTCGVAARDGLLAHIAGRVVSCASCGEDRYGRMLAICSANAENLNAWIVREGLALAYVQYSREYVSEEAAARGQRKGI